MGSVCHAHPNVKYASYHLIASPISPALVASRASFLIQKVSVSVVAKTLKETPLFVLTALFRTVTSALQQDAYPVRGPLACSMVHALVQDY